MVHELLCCHAAPTILHMLYSIMYPAGMQSQICRLISFFSCRMIFFSREMGLVKKQLRLHPQFRLAQEFCIQEKNGSYLFIIEKRQ